MLCVFFSSNCCFFQCLPPVYLQSEYTLTCMLTSTLYVVAHAALLSVIAHVKVTVTAITALHMFDRTSFSFLLLLFKYTFNGTRGEK